MSVEQSSSSIEKQQQTCEYQRQQDKRQHTVGPPTSPGEIGLRSDDMRHHVDVGEVGPYDQCGGAESRSTAQTAAGESHPDESVADWVYSSLASSSS